MTTVLDASKALLVDVTKILNKKQCNYVIVGGWSPYLRNRTKYYHPGTKDVDVLFSDAHARGGIREIIETFLSAGFLVSAKHDFQLLKSIEVDGKELVFNVDLLHPSETIDNPELLVDHLNLGIFEDDFGDTKIVRSIVLPSSRLLFEPGLSSPYDVICPITGITQRIPLITEAGCILSKCMSVSLGKRKRDSFDIFVSAEGITPRLFADVVKPYMQIEGVKIMLDDLRQFLSQKAHPDEPELEFDLRVRKYAQEIDTSVSPATSVLAVLNAI